jgi:tRNA dimethylallyltransferase
LFREGRDALQGYRTLKIGLMPDRDALYAALDARCAAMFEAGLPAEIEHILGLGYSPACKPFESHGYKQALQLRNGELTPKEALFYAQRNTRNYAKRQMTWFRKEADVTWFKGFAPAITGAALAKVAAFLCRELQ